MKDLGSRIIHVGQIGGLIVIAGSSLYLGFMSVACGDLKKDKKTQTTRDYKTELKLRPFADSAKDNLFRCAAPATPGACSIESRDLDKAKYAEISEVQFEYTFNCSAGGKALAYQVAAISESDGQRIVLAQTGDKRGKATIIGRGPFKIIDLDPKLTSELSLNAQVEIGARKDSEENTTPLPSCYIAAFDPVTTTAASSTTAAAQ